MHILCVGSWTQEQIQKQMQARGEHTNKENTLPRAMIDAFCNATMLQNTTYIARGIYEDGQGNDQNHTFSVIGHEHGQSYHFSVIECVAPIFIFHDKTDQECEHIKQEFAKNYGIRTKMHVTNK